MSQLHNALDRATELTRGFRKLFGLTAAGSGVERLSETLTPTVDVWAQPYMALMRGDRLGWGVANPGAVAGQYGAAQLSGTVRSANTIIVVRRVVVDRSVQLRVSNSAVLLGANGSWGPGDLRLGESGTGGSLTSAVTWTTAAAISGTFLAYLPGAGSYPVEVILRPTEGAALSALRAWHGTVNTTFLATFFWTEHDLLPGEQYRA